MSLVLTDVADGVGTLTLDNPDERNTLTAPMVAEIIDAMEAFEADDAVCADGKKYDLKFDMQMRLKRKNLD